MSDDDNNNKSPSLSPSPSPSHNALTPALNPATIPAPAPPRPSPFPPREDCWSEDATHTLIGAWGSHFLELKRGNLRQNHWQAVADAVNSLHGHTKKQHRTDVQCKNRIDTLKKKYKIEKTRVLQSNGEYASEWPFFSSLDALIGPNFKPSPATAPEKSSPVPVRFSTRRKTPLPPPPSAVPVAPRSKRPVAAVNYSAMAAAAAASDSTSSSSESENSAPASFPAAAPASSPAEGYSRLADAIGRFAEIYERVEEAKQRQMVELEKQRMQFAKDLEIQRMKLIMESQVQLERLKRTKNSNSQAGSGKGFSL